MQSSTPKKQTDQTLKFGPKGGIDLVDNKKSQYAFKEESLASLAERRTTTPKEAPAVKKEMPSLTIKTEAIEQPVKQIKDKPKSAKAAAKPNKEWKQPILSEHTVKGGLDFSGVTKEEMIANSIVYQPIYRNE